MDICTPRVSILLSIVFLFIVGLSVVGGYFLGIKTHEQEALDAYSQVASMLARDRNQLMEEKREVQVNLDALAIRLGSLQSHILRLDALGDRLVDAAKLDANEFDFSDEPALGGLETSESAQSQTMSELVAGVNAFNQLLIDRSQKLDLLDELIANRQLNEETSLSGRPIVKGWLSSKFGQRIDPKTGKKAFHHGRDYAGKEGNTIVAVASGMVLRAERQKGYGNLIEIKHTDGYSTIYAHNKKNLVSIGDFVKKGEKIALMGSTGRSTGPHVHFEVRKNGKYLNPKKVVRNK